MKILFFVILKFLNGDIILNFEQLTQDNLSICILLSEILLINPNNAPSGHIFVQKNLFLNNVIIKTIIVAIIPNLVKLISEEKYVYGSIYLIKNALPVISAPKVIAKIKY